MVSDPNTSIAGKSNSIDGLAEPDPFCVSTPSPLEEVVADVVVDVVEEESVLVRGVFEDENESQFRGEDVDEE
ncbi:hypothetical protein HK102_012066, partial [Quaeritorhiza haematococci]